MKFIYIYILLSILFLSCKERVEPTSPELPPAGTKDPLINQSHTDFPIYETKEPYFEIKDKGFEALLIMWSIDSDNQINGKVAHKDVLEMEKFGHKYPEHQDLPWLLRLFLERKHGAIPALDSFKDVKYFKNIKSIESLSKGNNDLTQNTALEKIELYLGKFESLDLRGLTKLKSVVFKYPPMPPVGYPGEIYLANNTSLEVFQYMGDARSIDFSAAPNLKQIHFSSYHYADSVIDLSNNIHLDKVFIGQMLRDATVLVSMTTMEKVKKDTSGNFQIPDNVEWKVKE
jgi:hypothetical protein